MWKWFLGSHLMTKFDKLGTYAAALAYSFVLSVIPFLGIAFALTYEMFGSLDPKTYQAALDRILPLEHGNHADLTLVTHIAKAVETGRNVGVARTIGLLFAFYVSFNLMNQIVRTLLFIFDDSRRLYEWTWRVFIKTMALLAVWMFLLLTVTVSAVIGVFLYNNPNSNERFLSMPWHVASDLIMVASLFGAVSVTYYLVPSKRPRFREVRDGAMLASVGWIGCGLVFTRIIPGMMGMNMVYQALGSIVIVLLWAQACAWSLIIGACWIARFSPRSKH
jgi:YihY family inner membrane protein